MDNLFGIIIAGLVITVGLAVVIVAILKPSLGVGETSLPAEPRIPSDNPYDSSATTLDPSDPISNREAADERHDAARYEERSKRARR